MKELVKDFSKKYSLVLIIFLLAGLVGGFLAGLDLLDSYPPEMKEEIFSQGFSETTLAVVTGVQYATYGLVLGVLGIILAKNIRLWKDKFTLEPKPFIYAAIVGIIGGVSMISFDLIWFGKEVPLIADSYLVKPSIATILGSMILGGIVEEVMLRLFMMSLIAFVLLKIFRKTEKADVIFIVANIISALLFAASHLPSTQIMIGLTPIIIFRCFLLNGGLGLLFGRLYRKHGIMYAMIAHAACHLVSKLIWIVFI